MDPINTTAKAFRALTEPVLPLAEKDGYTPLLGAVKVFTMEGHLAAMATDRYVAGMQRSDIPAEGFEAIIPAAALRQIYRIFPAGRRHDSELTITGAEEDGHPYITVAGDTADQFLPEITLRIKSPDMWKQYPTLPKLFNDVLAKKVDGYQTLNLEFLSRFRNAAQHEPSSATTLEFAGNTTLVHVGSGFVGMQMSMRPANGSEPNAVRDTWIDTLTKMGEAK